MLTLPLLLALALPAAFAVQEGSQAPWLASRNALVGAAQSALTIGAERRAALSTPEEVRAWQAATRANLLSGFAPLPGADREAPAVRLVRKLQRANYAIEHLLIETRPGMHISAHVYVPDPALYAPPYSAVLVACGHADTGKAHPVYQQGGASLARHGILALIYDPLDQGERMQALDADGKHVRWGTRAHNVSGAQAMLVGWSQAGLEAWDGMRCLDALAARADVHEGRFGICGNSGGGTQAAQLFAIDERLRVAAPSCYITSFAQIVSTIGPQDAEQNLYGQLRMGLDHADYLAVRAPAPALVCSAAGDFFSIEGTRDAVAAARAVYAIMGQPEACDIVTVEGQHGWVEGLILPTVAWMARWLDGREIEPLWEDAVPMTPAEASVVESGQVLHVEGERTVLSYIQDEAARSAQLRASLTLAERIAGARASAGVRSFADLAAPELRAEPDPPAAPDTDGKPAAEAITAATARVRTVNDPDHPPATERWRAIFADGIELPVAHRPNWEPPRRANELGRAAPPPPLIIVGAGAWSQAENEESPWISTWWLDPLACADAAPREGRWYGSSGPVGRDAAYGLLLGRPIIGRQAEQILAFVKSVSNGRVVHIKAAGPAALAALHAVACEPQLFGWIEIETPLGSWEDLLTSAPNEQLLPYAVPSALKHYDLPDLRAWYAQAHKPQAADVEDGR